MVNKSTILNRFVLHTLQRNITHLAVITRRTNIRLGILKGGNWKRAKSSHKRINFVPCNKSIMANKLLLNNLRRFVRRIKSPAYALIARNISRVNCPKLAKMVIFKSS